MANRTTVAKSINASPWSARLGKADSNNVNAKLPAILQKPAGKRVDLCNAAQEEELCHAH
jgi:hypothetical protein